MTESVWARIRRSALWLLFSAVLLIPKTLSMRRRPRTWNRARLIAGSLAAILLAAGVIGYARVWVAVVGGVFLILAMAIPPERPRLSVDARAKELGAVVVVHGGAYRSEGSPEGGGSAERSSHRDTRLFVGPRRLHLLDAGLRVLVEIPVADLTELRALSEGKNWKLDLQWSREGNRHAAELVFDGPFAEHFARVAESTVRSMTPNPLPILK